MLSKQVTIDARHWMRFALEEAELAGRKGEIPVGAVVVKDDEIIGRGYNRRMELNDPTAHAELLALRSAGDKLGDWNLSGGKLYVTLEPCPMCAGAIILARIEALYYGVDDPKTGSVSSLYQLLEDSRFNHNVLVYPGTLEDECRKGLESFFQNIRK